VLQLEVAKIELEVREAQRADELAELNHKTTVTHELFAGTFRLYGEVDNISMERLRTSTGRYAAAYPGAPITLIISSPGGSIFDGFVLFDHLRALSDDGHKITTVVRGMAASMAAVLAQAGDVRVIGPESFLMIHEPSSEMWGKTSDMSEHVATMKRLRAQMEQIMARRAKLSAKEIKAKSLKTDWYVTAKESKAFGFCDRIG
jgi:ATP-dependent Clp endopeptidase proteolytic subunit ClpP